MPTIAAAAKEFLAKRRIAVTGVSRNAREHGANYVFRRLRECGYSVVPINPNVTEIEGARAFPDLASIPGGVEAVVIGTRPETALATMRECIALGIGYVWMHRSFGGGSVSPDAAQLGRYAGLTVIEGGCPLMFGPTADIGHKILRPILQWTGAVPKQV